MKDQQTKPKKTPKVPKALCLSDLMANPAADWLAHFFQEEVLRGALNQAQMSFQSVEFRVIEGNFVFRLYDQDSEVVQLIVAPNGGLILATEKPGLNGHVGAAFFVLLFKRVIEISLGDKTRDSSLPQWVQSWNPPKLLILALRLLAFEHKLHPPIQVERVIFKLPAPMGVAQKSINPEDTFLLTQDWPSSAEHFQMTELSQKAEKEIQVDPINLLELNDPYDFYDNYESKAERIKIASAKELSGEERDLREYLNSFLIVFSDGESLWLSSLLFHPYGLLLPLDPDDLYTSFKAYAIETHPALQDWELRPKQSHLGWGFHIDFQDIFLQLLNRLAIDKVAYFLTHKLTSTGAQDLHQVKAIERLPGEIQTWSIKGQSLVCRIEFGKNPMIALKGAFYDLSLQKIFVNPVMGLFRSVKTQKKVDIDWDESTGSLTYQAQLSNDNEVLKAVRGLFPKLQDEYQAEVILPEGKDVSQEAVTLDLIWQPEKDTLEFRVDPGQVPLGIIVDYLQSASPIIGIIEDGIGGFFRWDSNASLLRNRTPSRALELKLLRHKGFALRLLTLLLESEDFQSNELTKPKANKLIKEILKEAPSFLVNRTQETTEATDKTVREFKASPSFTRILRTVLLDTHEVLHNTYYQMDQGLLYQFSQPKLGLAIIEAFVATFLENLSPREMVKEKFKSIQPLDPSDLESFDEGKFRKLGMNSLEPTTLGGFSIKNLKLPLSLLKKPNFQLYRGSQKISILDSVKIQTQMHAQSNDLDYFSLNPEVFFDGVPIDIGSINDIEGQQLLDFKGQLYLCDFSRLPQIKSLQQFWERFKAQALSSGRMRSEEIFNYRRSQVLDLIALELSGVPVIGDPKWKESRAVFTELIDGPKQVSVDRYKLKELLPQKVIETVKSYQIEGIQWLFDHQRMGLGCILADDMGLGKTLQALSALQILKAKQPEAKVLVIVPTSLLLNWENEIKKFDFAMDVMKVGSKAEARLLSSDEFANGAVSADGAPVVLTTYGVFASNFSAFSQHQWQALVLDEAQVLKNLAAQKRKLMAELKVDWTLILTGTPLENNLMEFFSLIDLAVPGALGHPSQFRQFYMGTSTQASGEKLVRTEAIEHLKNKTRVLLLRRNKSIVAAQLPQKLENVIPLEFEKKQQQIYRDLALSWNEKVLQKIDAKGEASAQLEMLTALMRLRQTCSHPGVVPQIKYLKTPPKFELLLESLEDILGSGHKVLVFTNFKKTLDKLMDELSKTTYPSFSFSGETPRKQREKILTEFKALSGGAVLAMTLKTGGVGLNLTEASYVIHIEPWWNPAVENQATDRAHRLGQSRDVMVYRYIMKDSIEERMETLKSWKQKTFDALLAEDVDSSSGKISKASLSLNDFRSLVSEDLG